MNSYVIWFWNKTYTIAWGMTPEEAKQSFLADWAKGIVKVEATDRYREPLPHHAYIAYMAGAPEPTIHQPLNQPTHNPLQSPAEIMAQFAELKAMVEKLSKKDEPPAEPANEG